MCFNAPLFLSLSLLSHCIFCSASPVFSEAPIPLQAPEQLKASFQFHFEAAVIWGRKQKLPFPNTLKLVV